MRSYLVNTAQTFLRRTEPPEMKGNPVGMYTFTPDTPEIRDFWMMRLNTIFRYYRAWFSDIESPRPGVKWEKDRMYGSSAHWLQKIMGELVENVMGHARGIGYLAIELNPEPGKGLHIYVGDTGIGLASGLKQSYRMKKPTDEEAVCMAMSLGDKLGRRRRLAGTLSFGGRGLEHTGVLLRRLQGTISIRSGEAMASFSPTKFKGRKAAKVYCNMYSVQGTHIHIYIPSRWKSY